MTPDDSIRVELARKTAKSIVDHGSVPMATLKESIILQEKVDALLSKEIEFPEQEPFPEIPEVDLTPVIDKIDELITESKKKDLLEYDLQIDEKTRQKLKGDKGERGEKGLDGIDGLDGKDGKDGLNGKDGSPDTPEQVVAKLESLKGDKRLDVKAVKGFDQAVLDKINSQPRPGGYFNMGGGSSSGGASTFTALTDAPSSYTGQGTKFVRVNAGETGLEFTTVSGGGDALTSAPLSQFAATTSLQLKGVISDETGSGALVFANSPNITTPTGIVKGDVGLGNVVNLDTSTTANITDSTNKRFVTDAQQTVISNTSGTNTGDNAVNSLYSGLVSNATHTGDATGATVLTLATVNSNVGSFGSASSVSTFTVNAKGLITAAANAAISITSSAVSDFASAVAALITGKADNTTTISTAAPLSGGGDLSANRTLTTSMSTNKLIGRGTAGTGVFEEITLGTNLSLSGTTLNATGGGGLSDGDYGDITVSGSGTIMNIDAATIGLTELSATGTPSATTFLRGDNTWATPSGGGGGSLTKGVAEVDFGANTQQSDISTVSVADATVTSTSYPSVSMYAVATTDHDPDDYMVEGLIPYVTNVQNGVGFDISVRAPNMTFGKYKVTYQF